MVMSNILVRLGFVSWSQFCLVLIDAILIIFLSKFAFKGFHEFTYFYVNNNGSPEGIIGIVAIVSTVFFIANLVIALFKGSFNLYNLLSKYFYAVGVSHLWLLSLFHVLSLYGEGKELNTFIAGTIFTYMFLKALVLVFQKKFPFLLKLNINKKI